MTWIETVSNVRFDLLEPSPSQVMINDIAVSLSRQVRFNGHTKIEYTIAQHSMFVREIVAHNGGSREQQFAALLHDAHEAYIGDIPSPLKWALGEDGNRALGEIQDRIDRAIAARFGFDHSLFSDDLVRLADASALWYEKEILVSPTSGDDWRWDLILGDKAPLEAPGASSEWYISHPMKPLYAQSNMKALVAHYENKEVIAVEDEATI